MKITLSDFLDHCAVFNIEDHIEAMSSMLEKR